MTSPPAHRLFLGETRLWALVPAAALPMLAAGWALFAPPIVLSSEMTWDLLFNLAGAWHLRFGHVPHVDFHEPVGTLNFLLTKAGFALVGTTPRAVLAGLAIAAGFVCAFACWAACRRLPPLPAFLFVVFAGLAVLRPANVGDLPNAYSFAMAYNRSGWSLVSVIALVLFLPPRGHANGGDRIDMVFTAAALAALFYLKMTYFAASVGLLALALVVCPHVAARRTGWVAVGGVALALVAAPFDWPYLADLAAAARAGIVREDAAFFINDVAANAGEYAPWLAAPVLATWLWRRGTAPARLPVATVALLGASLALLSQNSQSHGVPLAVVIAFLFYDVVRRRGADNGSNGSPPLAVLGALLLFPLAAIASAATSLAGYELRTTQGYMRVVDTTQLAGLAAPAEPPGLLAAFAGDSRDKLLLNRARAVRPRYELSPYEYLESLQEAASLLRAHGLASGRIAVLDQVDPLPFMLGLEPPRGGNLWSGAGAPIPSAEDYLGDADRVLVPRFTTNLWWTETALRTYGPYLAAHFPDRIEGSGWTVLSRSGRRAVPDRRQ